MAFILVSSLTTVMAANILMWIPVASRSHFNSWSPIANRLLDRGHTITLVSCVSNAKLEKHQNVTYVQTWYSKGRRLRD